MLWLHTNITPKKTSGILDTMEQMVETRKWKAVKGIGGDDSQCRLCKNHDDTIHHLLSGCEVITGTDYPRQHNNALMVLAVNWATEKDLLPASEAWKSGTWKKGHVLRAGSYKLSWNFKYHLRNTNLACRPDLTLEDCDKKRIFLVCMACPQEQSISETKSIKLRKYQQLAYETRERRPAFKVEVIPVVI